MAKGNSTVVKRLTTEQAQRLGKAPGVQRVTVSEWESVTSPKSVTTPTPESVTPLVTDRRHDLRARLDAYREDWFACTRRQDWARCTEINRERGPRTESK